jgi:hypothetical protein
MFVTRGVYEEGGASLRQLEALPNTQALPFNGFARSVRIACCRLEFGSFKHALNSSCIQNATAAKKWCFLRCRISTGAKGFVVDDAVCV